MASISSPLAPSPADIKTFSLQIYIRSFSRSAKTTVSLLCQRQKLSREKTQKKLFFFFLHNKISKKHFLRKSGFLSGFLAAKQRDGEEEEDGIFKGFVAAFPPMLGF